MQTIFCWFILQHNTSLYIYTLDITSTKNYKEVDDFKEEDYPILQLERNASKATKTQGLTGRGITIRTVPASAMKTGARANNLTIDYNEIS